MAGSAPLVAKATLGPGERYMQGHPSEFRSICGRVWVQFELMPEFKELELVD